jgi:hypothetical protein
MKNEILENDVVRLVRPLPEKGLEVGSIGTVMLVHDNDAYEVEFSDVAGITRCTLALPGAALELERKYPWPGRPLS